MKRRASVPFAVIALCAALTTVYAFSSPTKYRVRIATVGMDPFTIEIPVGERVRFINNDPNGAHEMTSSCSELDAVGKLEPEEWGETDAFLKPKTCKYVDGLYPQNPLRHGVIIVR